MSDADAIAEDTSKLEVFPSLPDVVLQKMGLLGSNLREKKLTEEETEEKFTQLSLAFAIDSATIRDRRERQKRKRDQTETNFSDEIARLVQRVNRMKRLCVNYETTELLSIVLTQVDIAAKASALAASSAERYGAVQHEERLADAVELMVTHVNSLKQQRDAAKRQLQYTKRVLQESSLGTPIPSPHQRVSPTGVPNGNIGRRRASIATISQPLDLKSLRSPIETKKVIRRTTDLVVKTNAFVRLSRPNRLELNIHPDLLKIRESSTETEPTERTPEEAEEEEKHKENGLSNESETSDVSSQETDSSQEDSPENEVDISRLSRRELLLYKLERVQKYAEMRFNKWTEDGTIHEVCYFYAFMCFSISLLLLLNILLEYESSKWGFSLASKRK